MAPPGTTRAIFGDVSRNFLSGGFGVELLYSFVIIACSLMIYFGTRELYSLSNHKGIHYFRLTFLFFALAYFFRSCIKFIVLYFNVGAILDISPRSFGLIFGPITLFVFMYLSSMAIFYLVLSVVWKKHAFASSREWFLHSLALLVSLVVVLSKSVAIYLLIHVLFFGAVSYTVYFLWKQKKSHRLFIIYELLLFFWLLNILDILIPRFFIGFQFILYLSSILIFLVILYKVLRKTGST